MKDKHAWGAESVAATMRGNTKVLNKEFEGLKDNKKSNVG